MTPIFRTVMVGVDLPKPWSPTHMKSYAKGRAPHRVWAMMVSDKEAVRINRKIERAKFKKLDDVLRTIARKAGVSVREVRSYVADHAVEIFS